MKRVVVLVCAAALACTLGGCIVADGGGAGVPAKDGSGVSTLPAPGGTDAKPGTDASGGKKPTLATPDLPSYWERLESEWQNAPAKGYVWTIDIDDVGVIDVLGLATAEYHVTLSASHIGPDMFGAYFGEFGFESSADLSGLEAVMTAWSGSMEYDADVWFKNTEFLCSLAPYDDLEEQQLETAVQSGGDYANMSAEERAMMDALLGDVFAPEVQSFETASEAQALWWDLDMRMTEGDMGASLGFYGIAGGVASGFSATDSSGQNTEAVVDSIVGTFRESSSLRDKFDERYGENAEFRYPMPYTLKVYPGGHVVMTVYSLDGSPMTVKCYGTIDKVPVEQVKVLPNE